MRKKTCRIPKGRSSKIRGVPKKRQSDIAVQMPKVPQDGRGHRRPRRKRSERLPYCITIVVAGVGDGSEGGREERPASA